MVAPLPQERLFKREFDMNRLAALRGDLLSFPEIEEEEGMGEGDVMGNDFSPIETPETRRFFGRDSEDALMRQFPQPTAVSEGAYDPSLDPANFSFMQRQAQMAAGIGAPELLPPEIAQLPDPEYSTEDEEVTFGESISALEEEGRRAETMEGARAIGNAARAKIKQAGDAAIEEAAKKIKKKGTELALKWGSNGAGALDEGEALFIVKFLAWLYGLARGVVTLFSGAIDASESSDSGELGDMAKSMGAKGIKTLFPYYQPLIKPVDFGLFLFNSVIVSLALLSVLIEFIIAFAIPVILIVIFNYIIGGING